MNSSSQNMDSTLAWRLVLDQIDLLEALPVLITCRQFNQIYTVQDWLNFFYLKNGHFPETYRGSIRSHLLARIKADLNIKLRIIEKGYEQFRGLSWDGYSLTNLHYLYKDWVEQIVAQQQAQYNQQMAMIGEQFTQLVQHYPGGGEQFTALAEKFHQPNPDPISIMNEFHQLLEANPSTKPMADQLSQFATTQCTLL